MTVGCDLVIEARTWRVEEVSDDGFQVKCAEDASYTCLGFEYIDRAIGDGSCTVVTPAMAEKRKQLLQLTGGFERVQQLSPFQQAVIRAKLAVLNAMKCLEAEGHKLTQRYLDQGPVRSALRRIAIDETGAASLFTTVHDNGEAVTIPVPKGRTLQKYRQLLEQFDGNPVVLLVRDHLKGPRGDKARKICDLGERFIAAVVEGYLAVSQPKAAVVFRDTMESFPIAPDDFARNFKFPSLTTVRNRIRQLGSTVVQVGRLGRRAAANRLRSGTSSIPAVGFGEYVETDQCLLSIFVDASGQARSEFWKKEDQEKFPERGIGEPRDGERVAKRYWLSLVLDVATRMILGWHLSETATAEATKAALRMAMRSKERKKRLYGCELEPAPAVGFTELRSDNGTAVRNKDVMAALAGLNVMVRLGRAYEAADKPYVERLFGTTDLQVLNRLPGYAGPRPGALPGADPMKEAVLTHDELYAALTKFFIDKYPARPHRGTELHGATPIQKMAQVVEKYGAIAPPCAEQRRLHLGEVKKLSVTSEGVLPFKIPYNSRDLQLWANTAPSRMVTVYLDPDNLAQVTVEPIGSCETLTADLSMTNLRHTNLPNALRLLKEASLLHPESAAVTDDDVGAVVTREGLQASLSDRARVERGYDRVTDYEGFATALGNVAARPSAFDASSRPAGSISSFMVVDEGPTSPGTAAAPAQLGISEVVAPSSAPLANRPTNCSRRMPRLPPKRPSKPSSGASRRASSDVFRHR
ncbi:DDE-type integrase/transposase/recombinase [Wenxinia marina]|uniref:DDE-type integrase/transposase/recombinase n=1 Tax=Wenxinia marina TaxID=390641 RepID=UPI0006884C3C|nr:DDE-type integrase/transposase/recombinase [Wenxinia marina]GGL81652.1 hypothetical protein GCM10011392_40330 [Wenxinia marina]